MLTEIVQCLAIFRSTTGTRLFTQIAKRYGSRGVWHGRARSLMMSWRRRRRRTRNEKQNRERPRRTNLTPSVGPSILHPHRITHPPSLVDVTICPLCLAPILPLPPPLRRDLSHVRKNSKLVELTGGVWKIDGAPMMAEGAFCDAHRFILSETRENGGYPTSLNFDSIPKRLRDLKSVLQEYISHPDSLPRFALIRDEYKNSGSREFLQKWEIYG
jgi:hypothetical protein